MSPRRQPHTLFYACISHLSGLLEELAQLHKTRYTHPDILNVLKHITHFLPGTVQEAIGARIVADKERSQQTLFASHIKILLRLKVKNLNFSGSVVQSGVLDVESASHLKKLRLFYLGSSDRATRMCTFFNSAHQLTHLQCTHFCNNKMLAIIASSCSNLRSLDLRVCDVTDEGILRLCGFKEDLSHSIDILGDGGKNGPIPSSACSKSLREITFSMTCITEAGVAIIILALNNIHILRVPDIAMSKLFTFIKTIEHKGIQSNLKEFHSSERLDEDQLTVLTGLCPNLEYIQMSFNGNIDVDLLSLHKLIHLKKLTSVKFADVNTDALMSYLEKVGPQLENLFLHTDSRAEFSRAKIKITHSHLWNLASYCPNLKSLILDGYNLDEDSNPIQYVGNRFFQNLRTLKLCTMKLSDEDLKIFLCKCTSMNNLELVLKDPHVFHDQLVSELLDGGVWRNLTKIKIMHSTITKKTMFRLVNECPKLQILGNPCTWLVPQNQINDFKEKVRRENLDIEIY